MPCRAPLLPHQSSPHPYNLHLLSPSFLPTTYSLLIPVILPHASSLLYVYGIRTSIYCTSLLYCCISSSSLYIFRPLKYCSRLATFLPTLHHPCPPIFLLCLVLDPLSFFLFYIILLPIIFSSILYIDIVPLLFAFLFYILLVPIILSSILCMYGHSPSKFAFLFYSTVYHLRPSFYRLSF